MTAISSKTRAEIKGYLEGFIDGLVDEYKGREIIKPDNAVEYLSRFSPLHIFGVAYYKIVIFIYISAPNLCIVFNICCA